MLEYSIILPGDNNNKTSNVILYKKIEEDEKFINIQLQYKPNVNDVVIGTVIKKTANGYLVKITDTLEGIIKLNQFSGSTLQHYPIYKTGTAIICGVVLSNIYLPLELSCKCDIEKRTWDTNETYLGELTGGILTYIGFRDVQKLLKNENPVIYLIGKILEFEIAMGENGFIYIKSKDSVISNFISILIKEGLNINNFDLLQNHVGLAIKNFININ